VVLNHVIDRTSHTPADTHRLAFRELLAEKKNDQTG
jgi:hypothetical protein